LNDILLDDLQVINVTWGSPHMAGPDEARINCSVYWLKQELL